MPRALVFLILALPLVGAYALYATGIVVIYQASRVVNLAHGAMATVPAYLFFTLVERAGVPAAVALPIGLASGALLGVAIERVFVRRLRPVSSTAQTVGTVAAFGLLISLTAKIWGASGLTAPGVFPEGDIGVGSSILRYGQIGLCAVAVAAAVTLTLLFRRTMFGLAMRGAAINPRAASLVGVNPEATSVAAWALGGLLAAAAGILLAAVTVLNPYTLSASVLPAYVAALIGGLGSVPLALAGAAVVGVVIGFVPLLADVPVLDAVLGQVGGPELALAVVAIVVMIVRGQRFVSTDVRTTAPRASRAGRPLRIPPVLALIAIVGWVFIPRIPFSILGTANQALVYAIVAASLVLLTGWVGQISLAQAAFVGIGAFGSIQVSRRLGIPFPFTIPVAAALSAAVAAVLGLVALRVRGLYLAVATLIFAWMADQYLFASPWFVGAGGSATATVSPIGYPGGFPYFDFRNRRVFYIVALAVVTLVVVALANLKRSKTGRALSALRGSEVAAASIGIDITRYKLLAFAVSGFIAGIAGSLIVVDQPTIVASQFAFTASLFFLSVAVVGGLESLAGAIASAVLFSALTEVFFRVEALAGWLDVVSAGLLVTVLLFYPGGLARVTETLAPVTERLRKSLAPLRRPMKPGVRASGATRLRGVFGAGFRRFGLEIRGAGRELGASGSSVLDAAERRSPRSWLPGIRVLRRQLRGVGAEAHAIGASAHGIARRAAALGRNPVAPAPKTDAHDCLAALTTPRDEAPAVRRHIETHDRAEGAVLSAEGITVRFGGLVAVQDVTVAVRENEIVGLIGPNGAGKTTVFNVIAGFAAPSAGRVIHQARDVTSLTVHARALRGIGRTFQTVQLFEDLSVRDNLLVATHGRNGSSFGSHLVVTNSLLAAEEQAFARTETVARLVGIEDVLDRQVAGLPFGVQRMVEIGRALVTGARLVMLDEPASGLDGAETDRLAALLRGLRNELGISILVIEHDVRFVMALCDYVYVLDQGLLIEEGRPATVRRAPQVIAAYLGAAAGSNTA